MDILEGLNPEQRAAVVHTDGPMLVVAGAGTGKTRVITHRIAYLIAQGKAKPGQILALTFTEKAAREMEERLYDLIGWESFQVSVMTFHAFGAELLGRYSTHLGRSIRGGLLNDGQKALLLSRHLKEAKLSYYGRQDDVLEFMEKVVKYIGQLQNAGVTAESYENFVKELKHNPEGMHPRDVAEQEDLAVLYRLYEAVKVKTGTFDYNDQLEQPLRILMERPNIAERLSKEFTYVLVDEYQDTNAVQDKLLRMFIGKTGNLFAVGDDDQAIYGFRGADIGNILRFSEYFHLQKPAVLTQNYRSGQEILDAAYRLIGHNDPWRLEAKLGITKRLEAQFAGVSAGYAAYRTAADEQEGVVTAVAERIAQGGDPAAIAVLAATHAPLKAMAKVLRTRGIPFALSSTVNIFEQPELMGLWHLLKWLAWRADDETIAQVLVGPFLSWPIERVRRLVVQARTELVSLEDIIRGGTDEDSLGLAGVLDGWREWARDLPVSQLAYRLVFETGLSNEWRRKAERSARMVKVFEDLQRLLDQMQDYETVEDNTTLTGYFQAYPKPPVLMAPEPVGDTRGVQLLTVHASKGLEFDTVFLIGCSQRSWSAGRSAGYQIPPALAQELELPPEHEFRRLMYVAITRARREIVVSAATNSTIGAKLAVTPMVGELFGREVMERQSQDKAGDRLGKALSKLQRFYPLQDVSAEQGLPFETKDGWLELSVTEIGGYSFCPFEFYLQSVLRIQQPVGSKLSFGNVLHKAFEVYFKGKLAGHAVGVQELHGLVDELWSERGYEDKLAAESDRTLAHVALDNFFVREEQAQRKVFASEMPVRFELPEAKLRLRGKIDALFEVEGGMELRDFKTGRNKTDQAALEKAARENLQLRTYALAYEELRGESPRYVTLDYVVTGVEGRTSLTPAILRNHRTKLIELAGGIRAREFAPNPSQLHLCSAVKYFGTGELDELAEKVLAELGDGE